MKLGHPGRALQIEGRTRFKGGKRIRFNTLCRDKVQFLVRRRLSFGDPGSTSAHFCSQQSSPNTVSLPSPCDELPRHPSRGRAGEAGSLGGRVHQRALPQRHGGKNWKIRFSSKRKSLFGGSLVSVSDRTSSPSWRRRWPPRGHRQSSPPLLEVEGGQSPCQEGRQHAPGEGGVAGLSGGPTPVRHWAATFACEGLSFRALTVSHSMLRRDSSVSAKPTKRAKHLSRMDEWEARAPFKNFEKH